MLGTIVTAVAALTATFSFAQTPVDSAVHGVGIPVVDVAIATRQGVCFAKTYGLMTTEATRFHAASISKLFTATEVMKLEQEGKLALTDRVGKHVAPFAGNSTTLYQLLTHTSGLRDSRRADGRDSEIKVAEYIQSLARQPPRSTHWQYTDANFNLLGRVIEKVRGAPFATVMQANLLTPLGMNQSTFDIEEVPASARVTSFLGSKPVEHPWDRAFAPSSGLQTTAADLAKFIQAVLLVQSSKQLPHMMTETTLSKMVKPQLPTEWAGVLQGLGWQLSSTKLGPQWRHAGSEAGFENLLTIYPEQGFGIIVMANREDWPRFELESELRTLMTDGAVRCAQ